MAELSQDQLHQLCEALGWQGGTFWQVLETVKSLVSPGEPVAWAVFAKNGNIRMWSTNTEAIQQFARDEGVAVTPLYAHPPLGVDSPDGAKHG